MPKQIQFRRGTASEWTRSNPVLAQGELGFETDTNKFKIGDGTHAWSNITYFTSVPAPSDMIAAINSSASIIDADNIASEIARVSQITNAITSHSAIATAHHTNINDPSAAQKAALAGQGGVPSDSNRFVVNSDPRLNEPRTPSIHASTHVVGGSDALPVATTISAGLLSAADKVKLNSIESGASADMNASEIVSLINASTQLIDDNNISSTIARLSNIQSAIGTHTNNASAHHTNINDPTSDQKAALVGTSGAPSNSNRFVTHTDSRMTNARTAIAHAASHLHGGTDDLGYGTAALRDAGKANGVAELDETGRVPSSQLPSYVDDVHVYNRIGVFPLVGETSKIYIAADTNITYRWTGSSYAEISASLALGETSATAYRGDRGLIAYNHSLASGNVHSITESEIFNLLNTTTIEQSITDVKSKIPSSSAVINYVLAFLDADIDGGFPYSTYESAQLIDGGAI